MRELQVVDTLFYYDGPILFVAQVGPDFYLAERIDNDEIVLVSISRTRAFNIANLLTTIRQAQRFPELKAAGFIGDGKITNYAVMPDDDWNIDDAKPLSLEEFIERRGELFPGGYDCWSYGDMKRQRRVEKRNRYAYKNRKGK